MIRSIDGTAEIPDQMLLRLVRQTEDVSRSMSEFMSLDNTEIIAIMTSDPPDSIKLKLNDIHDKIKERIELQKQMDDKDKQLAEARQVIVENNEIATQIVDSERKNTELQQTRASQIQEEAKAALQAMHDKMQQQHAIDEERVNAAKNLAQSERQEKDNIIQQATQAVQGKDSEIARKDAQIQEAFSEIQELKRLVQQRDEVMKEGFKSMNSE